MSLNTLVSILFITFFGAVQAQVSLPKVVHGRVERIENFESKYVTARNIDVWLPQGYSDTSKYAVLYMHDGQMIYDSEAEAAWNKQSWDVDDAIAELLKKDKIKKVIVVGIWNGGATRHFDYFPQKPFENLSQVKKDTVRAQLRKVGIANKDFQPTSDNYLQFLVKELKPMIDKKYAVLTDRENTFIMGSSMGGLISFYAISEYPKVFGGAACLSTHWPGAFTLANNPIPFAFQNYLLKQLPCPENHKIYFDCGDVTLDALYPKIQQKVDKIMTQKGYSASNWQTRYFPGENHSENAWKKRVHIPLEFLLKKTQKN
ncbi:alpha/beta hydrolase [Ochrovirga pacifica]|uniref:alpha/beta hydrolase n=1 Tax=Ochrovirga pacifica TaxID=1042376 RepID=UPI000255A2EB|nr:alpha/beta hydrolase-fold protein [Ochrovirga pacifica]